MAICDIGWSTPNGSRQKLKEYDDERASTEKKNCCEQVCTKTRRTKCGECREKIYEKKYIYIKQNSQEAFLYHKFHYACMHDAHGPIVLGMRAEHMCGKTRSYFSGSLHVAVNFNSLSSSFWLLEPDIVVVDRQRCRRRSTQHRARAVSRHPKCSTFYLYRRSFALCQPISGWWSADVMISCIFTIWHVCKWECAQSCMWTNHLNGRRSRQEENKCKDVNFHGIFQAIVSLFGRYYLFAVSHVNFHLLLLNWHGAHSIFVGQTQVWNVS